MHNPQVNYAAKKVTKKLSLEDMVELMQNTEAYVAIKDLKDEFPNEIPCRLINPSKPSIGKISKVIIDKTNETIFNN